MAAATAMAGIGIGLTLLSGMQQANAQGAQADYNDAMADINIRRSKLQEEDALKRGGVAANKYRGQVNEMAGSQKVAFAGQGVDVSSGSAADVVDETMKLGYEDARTIENNAFREALGFSQQQSDYKVGKKMNRSAADTNRTGTILTTGINAARMGADYYGVGK